jgi:hypothetical protein
VFTVHSANTTYKSIVLVMVGNWSKTRLAQTYDR